MADEIKCPAGEPMHPVLSPNDLDVECRIQGRLRPAKGSPCCAEYVKCSVWRAHKEQNWSARTVKVAETMRQNRSEHTLPNVEREKL